MNEDIEHHTWTSSGETLCEAPVANAGFITVSTLGETCDRCRDVLNWIFDRDFVS